MPMRGVATRRLVPPLFLLGLGFFLRLPFEGSVPTSAADAIPGVELVTKVQLKAYLSFIASDEMEGRDTPSRGLDATARFLGTMLERWGLEPASDDGTYLQKVPLIRRVVAPESTTLAIGARVFVFGRDFLSDGTAGDVSGAPLYVGHGLRLPARSLDPYEGLDVAGKVLVAHMGLPKSVSRAELKGKAGIAYDTAETYAASHGASAVILVPDFDALTNWERRRAQSVGRGLFELDVPPESNAPRRLPVVTASAELLDVLFADEAIDARTALERSLSGAEGPSFAFRDGKTVTLKIHGALEHVSTQNVAGILRGSDAALRDEYVALGAHYDHLGTDDRPGDRIFNGADDDGSGTATVLSLAEAFAHRREGHPRRSLLFVWHAGEEGGLWGSEWMSSHPPVPMAGIVTLLNVDMVGRSRAPGDPKPANAELTSANEIYVIGSKMMSSTLGELSERVNRRFLNLTFNYKYDDPADPNQFFFRSDHYNYARRGVPIIFYFSGVHEDYHQVTDSIEKIDFDKMERVARTIYATALAVAELPKRPAVDRALPKELTDKP